MLFSIYRWTAGFGRNKYPIPDSTITKETGIKVPKPHRNYLIKNKLIEYEHEDGKTGIYTIPPPNRISSTPKLDSAHPPKELNGYRPAKDIVKDNLKKERKNTLSNDLINEMKKKDM